MQKPKYKPKLNAGDLRQKLYFQYEKEGTDNEGFPSTVVIDYISSRAKLKTLKGRMFYEAAKENLQNSREFTVRYREKLDDENRPHNLYVMWKGKKHTIDSIENDDGLYETMTIYLKSVD